MTGIKRFWQEVHHSFDPMVPVPFGQPQLHAERDPDYNALATISRKMRAPTGEDRSRFLLTGAIGNGKSSELNFFTNELAQERIVVSFDLWGHLQDRVRDPKAIDRLQVWELIGLVGLAIYRAGKDRFGHRWKDEPKALEAALKALRKADAPGAEAEIDLGKLARGMTVVAGGVAGAALGGALGAMAGQAVGEAATKAAVAVVEVATDATAWTWKVGLLGAKGRGDQDGEVRDLLNAVNRMIMTLQAAYGRRLLLVLDGPDRITDPAQTEALFINSSLLGELLCDALFTAPLPLMQRQGQRVEPFKLMDLCNVPVLDREAPGESDPRGLKFFRQLVERRMAQVRQLLARDGITGPADPLPEALVDRLAYYSGGLARDFVTLVRGVALEALVDEREQIDSGMVDRVLREERRSREFYMTKTEIELLEGVMSDPQRGLPGGQDALELLRQKRLLAYPNDLTWYYPHPLLTLALLGRAGSTS